MLLAVPKNPTRDALDQSREIRHLTRRDVLRIVVRPTSRGISPGDYHSGAAGVQERELPFSSHVERQNEGLAHPAQLLFERVVNDDAHLWSESLPATDLAHEVSHHHVAILVADDLLTRSFHEHGSVAYSTPLKERRLLSPQAFSVSVLIVVFHSALPTKHSASPSLRSC